MSKDDIQSNPKTLRPNYKIISSMSEPVYSLTTDGTGTLTIEDGAAIGIDFAHAKIHEGVAYSVSQLFTAVTNGSFADMHIKTGTTKETHMLVGVSAEGKGYITLYRGTTYSSLGTTLSVHNCNEFSSNTTAAHVYSAPVTTTMGTVLYQDLIPAGTSSKTVGGVSNLRAERILNTSTDYLLRVENKSTTAGDISIEFNYYEIPQ
jgi:hypothetical protein